MKAAPTSVVRRRRLWCTAMLCAGLALAVGEGAGAATLEGGVALFGQVRQGDQSNVDDESPNDFYANASLYDLPLQSRIDTYFRLAYDFGTEKGSQDLYTSYIDIPNAGPGVRFTLGRQFLTEGAGMPIVADAGRLQYSPEGFPVSFTLYGGRPRYFEPTFSTDIQSQDEAIFGGNIRTTQLENGYVDLGFFQQERNGHELRQVVSVTGNQTFPGIVGAPNVYGRFAYDADHQNIDLATIGVAGSLIPGLRLNVQGSYYKPQDYGNSNPPALNLLEDAVFQLFSVSDMLQFRGGMRYTWTRSLSFFADYSYQHYKPLNLNSTNGNLANVGLLWLPEGDGLEIVRLEYYLADSRGGVANGSRVYYENRLYDRILFRTNLGLAGYDKESNTGDLAFFSRIGLGYLFTPLLMGELSMEANHNQRFDSDFRFGFLITYNFRQALGWPGGEV